MTTTPSGTGPRAVRDVRRATRDTQEPIIGGVAGGPGPAPRRARALGARRRSCVAAALGGSASCCTPACGWCCRPTPTSRTRHPAWRAPPAAAVARAGSAGSADVGPAIALAALGLGAILLLEAVLGQGAVFWPIFIGLVGIALLWRQADEAQRERWLDTTGRIDPVRAVFGSGGWAAYARLAAGVGLIVAALVLFSLRGGSLEMARDVTVAALLTVVGLAHRGRAVDLPAGLRPDRRAGRAGPHPGARRRGRAPARLGAADARPDPEERPGRHRPSPGWRAPRSATCGPGCTPARPPTTAPSPARCAGSRPRSRTPTGSRSRSSTSATARLAESAAPGRQRHPRGGHQRRQARRDRPGRRVRRGVTARRSTCSSATADVASTSTQVAEDRHGVRTASSTGWTGTAAPPTVRSTPGEGTEVRLHLPEQQEDTDG